MFANLMTVFIPLLKSGIDIFIKWKLIKEENAKKLKEALEAYDKSGTPAESQNAYRKIEEQIKQELEEEKKNV